MRILWVCDYVIPEFCDEFGIKKTVIGGWISGALKELEKHYDHTVGFCFPIFDADRMKDEELNGKPYYSFRFLLDKQNLDSELVNRFVQIIDSFQPDVVHIWGTEYVHSLAALRACEIKRIKDRAVIYIQGLVSVYVKHYLLGLPESVIHLEDGIHRSILEDRNEFAFRGDNERVALQEAQYIAGRTEWDKACAFECNPKAVYCYMPEILRSSFYENVGCWVVDNCIRHRIFVSQAHYPIKGFHYLLEALPIIKRVYADVTVHVGGENIIRSDTEEQLEPYGKYISNIINMNKLNDNIVFLGKLDEERMIEEYKQANVMVCCSSIENSSNSVCEAMMIGTPVVASYVGGIQDFIEHGQNGFLYDSNAPYMLAFYIIQLFSDENKSKEFSRNGSERIIHCLDRKKAVGIIHNTYCMIDHEASQ